MRYFLHYKSECCLDSSATLHNSTKDYRGDRLSNEGDWNLNTVSAKEMIDALEERKRNGSCKYYVDRCLCKAIDKNHGYATLPVSVEKWIARNY
jgi:hypothetical protein